MELPNDVLSGMFPSNFTPIALKAPACQCHAVPGVPGQTIALGCRLFCRVGRCGLADSGAYVSGYGFHVSICHGLGPTSCVRAGLCWSSPGCVA